MPQCKGNLGPVFLTEFNTERDLKTKEGMPCARQLLSLQACALLATGCALVATALRPFGFFRGVLSAAAATFSLEGVKETDHIHFGSRQAKTHDEVKQLFLLRKQKTTRT